MKVAELMDEQEERLWRASQRYMLGEISIAELEQEEKPQAINLRKAELVLAKVKPESAHGIADEQEERLWRASRRYMLGEISIAELEDVERHHAFHLRNALVALARWRLKLPFYRNRG
jgi:hypothetical protein